MSIDIQQRNQTLSDRVAAEIRAEMARKQISGRELARRLGRSANWVSLKVSGSQRLDLDDLAIIATALGVTVVDLFPRRDREVTLTFIDPAVDHVARRPFRNSAPTGGRPSGRLDRSGPPPGPRRTSRVLRPLSA